MRFHYIGKILLLAPYIQSNYILKSDVEDMTKKAFMDGWMQQRANGEEIIVRYK
jgi:hypothetical protein